MSPDWTKPSTAGTTSQSDCKRNENSAGNTFPNKTKRYDGSTGKSSEDSIEDEEELNIMDEMERAFEKAI